MRSRLFTMSATGLILCLGMAVVYAKQDKGDRHEDSSSDAARIRIGFAYAQDQSIKLRLKHPPACPC